MKNLVDISYNIPVPVNSINFFIVYAQEFQSAHVHNNLNNFQKADGAAVMMGQLAW